jgi:hypothetical protein
MAVRARLAAAPLVLAGCYASSVVAPQDRAVVEDLPAAAWRPAAAGDLDGLFTSARIAGDAALSLRFCAYVFATDGRYTGAALVDGDDGPAFQTLSGRWALGEGGLRLDGAPPARCEAAAGWLRLTTGNGSLLLHREHR